MLYENTAPHMCKQYCIHEDKSTDARKNHPTINCKIMLETLAHHRHTSRSSYDMFESEVHDKADWVIQASKFNAIVKVRSVIGRTINQTGAIAPQCAHAEAENMSKHMHAYMHSCTHSTRKIW